MKLSAPAYRLKHQAKIIARSQGIALHAALDSVARQQGFARWAQLAAYLSGGAPARHLLDQLQPGDLLLLGARPGHGKTQLGFELIVETIKAGGQAVFFTLEYTAADMLALFRHLGADPTSFRDSFDFDASDAINAEFMVQRLQSAPAGTLVVIDYLQLLDQRRSSPELGDQVVMLRQFAVERGLVMVFIAQIDRAFDASVAACPGPGDVRLPNALDLALFDKACFLHRGELQFSALH